MRLTVTELDDTLFQNLIRPRIAPGLISLGNSQASALALSSEISILTVVASGTGVVLPPVGRTQVFNRGGNDLLVYPPYGSQIEGFATNAPATVIVGSSATYTLATSTEYVVS